jgi:hypothetical protein
MRVEFTKIQLLDSLGRWANGEISGHRCIALEP